MRKQELIVLLGVTLAMTAGTQAQLPAEDGQWSGPWELDFVTGPNEEPYPQTHEIVHFALLPPPASDPTLARVAMWHRINTTCGATTPPCAPSPVDGLYGRVFVWKRSQPGRVWQLDTPPDYDDEQGVSCSSAEARRCSKTEACCSWEARTG